MDTYFLPDFSTRIPNKNNKNTKYWITPPPNTLDAKLIHTHNHHLLQVTCVFFFFFFFSFIYLFRVSILRVRIAVSDRHAQTDMCAQVIFHHYIKHLTPYATVMFLSDKRVCVLLFWFLKSNKKPTVGCVLELIRLHNSLSVSGVSIKVFIHSTMPIGIKI